MLVPHYCYHPSLPVAGGLPDVPGRGGEGAQADAGVRHRRGRGTGGARRQREGQEGPRGRAGAAAHQPPARLPDLRPGRRVRAAGLRVPGRPGRHPVRRYAKRFNPVEDFGPDVLYVPNRCILCTRCVRFMEDVAEDAGAQRARSGATGPTSASRREQQLDHPWAGNVVDLCPVGSLLSKDFLHKARAWDLDKTASVCPGCTQGCNITIDTRDDVVVRLRPAAEPRGQPPLHLRLRPDELPLDEPGRPDRGAAGPGRRPARRHRLGHGARPAGPAAARRLGLGGDPRLGAGVHRVARAGPAAARPVRASPPRCRCRWARRRRSPGIPNLALRRERAPNLVGAELLGYTPTGTPALREAARARPWSSCSMPT